MPGTATDQRPSQWPTGCYRAGGFGYLLVYRAKCWMMESGSCPISEEEAGVER
jgi:hypothetical protein